MGDRSVNYDLFLKVISLSHFLFLLYLSSSCSSSLVESRSEISLITSGIQHSSILISLVVNPGVINYITLIQNVTSRRDIVTYRKLKTMLVDIEVRKARTNAMSPLSVNVVEAEKSVKSVNYSESQTNCLSQKIYVYLIL